MVSQVTVRELSTMTCPPNRPFLRAWPCLWQRVGWGLTLGMVLGGLGWVPPLQAAVPEPQPSLQPSPTAFLPALKHHRPVVIIRRVPRSSGQVTAILMALDQDWGAVYLNGTLLLQVSNINRHETLQIPTGTHYLEFTGVARSDCWARGYLTVVNDAGPVHIHYSPQRGVAVQGGAIWSPDSGPAPDGRSICARYAPLSTS